jgi:hypothetical protein
VFLPFFYFFCFCLVLLLEAWVVLGLTGRLAL